MLVVNQCGSRLNPDALEFKPKSLSSMQVDTMEEVGPIQVPPMTSVDSKASSKEEVAKGRCSSRQVNHLEATRKGFSCAAVWRVKRSSLSLTRGLMSCT